MENNLVNNMNDQMMQQLMMAQQMMIQAQAAKQTQINNILNNMGNNNLGANFMAGQNTNPMPNPGASSQQQRGLNVNFRKSRADGQENPPILVQCMPDDKVSDVIKKYRKKAGDHDSTKFIFNAKNLNPCLTVAEAGITNNAIIFPIKVKEKDDNSNCLNF